MNFAQVGVFAVAAAGGLYFLARPAPADVYPVPITVAYSKLAHAKVPGGDFGVFHLGPPKISGNGVNKIDWTGHATPCSLTLSAVSTSSTRIAVSCGYADDDTETSFSTGLLRKRVIEEVDATMTGREFDPDKGTGQTAWRWPDDTVPHAGPADIQKDAMVQLGKNMRAAKEAEHAARAAARAEPAEVDRSSETSEGGRGDSGSEPGDAR